MGHRQLTLFMDKKLLTILSNVSQYRGMSIKDLITLILWKEVNCP